MAKSTSEPDPAPSTKSINIALPTELHRRLRMQAAADDTTITATVIAALDYYLTA